MNALDHSVRNREAAETVNGKGFDIKKTAKKIEKKYRKLGETAI